MFTKLRILLVLFCLLFAWSSALYSEVISGIGNLNAGGWDFSDSTNVPPQEADITAGFVVDPPLGWIVGRSSPDYAVIVMLPDSIFEDMRYVPEDTSVYSPWDFLLQDVTYAAITLEGHYVKFRFIYVSEISRIFEYVYQPDGSRILYDSTGTDNYTWGAIKKFFH